MLSAFEGEKMQKRKKTKLIKIGIYSWFGALVAIAIVLSSILISINAKISKTNYENEQITSQLEKIEN